VEVVPAVVRAAGLAVVDPAAGRAAEVVARAADPSDRSF